MFEKKTLFVAVVVGLLLLLVSVQYMSFGSGTDNAHAATSVDSGIADDNRKVFLPLVAKPYTDIEDIALMALYNSTNGPSWSNNTGWGVGDPCDMAWYGVSCDSGHVQRIDLENNQLTGPIPAELGKLSGLIGLDLEGNPLGGPIPAELGKLSSLRTLDLSFTQLSGSIPGELGSLRSLKWLNLDANQLSGPIPPELGNLSSLGFLALISNQLSGPIPAELANLSSLSDLYLIGNPSLKCWETKEALNWAKGLSGYFGPDAVCS